VVTPRPVPLEKKEAPVADSGNSDQSSITQFDRAHYDELTNYLKALDDDINIKPELLGPTADLRLDASLSSTLKAGSPNWSAAKTLATAAGAFGGSVHTQYVALELEQRKFVKAMKDATDVFEETSDLADYDAAKFVQEFPDIAGGTTT
jgi:hypothetical protein